MRCCAWRLSQRCTPSRASSGRSGSSRRMPRASSGGAGEAHLDVADAGGVEGRGHVAPGNADGMLEAAAEVDVALLVAQRHVAQFAVLAHLAAELEAFPPWSWRCPATARCRCRAECQMAGIGHGLGQAGGHAIGGDDVEAHAGAERDAGLMRALVETVGMLEDGDLAGDVHVVVALARQASSSGAAVAEKDRRSSPVPRHRPAPGWRPACRRRRSDTPGRAGRPAPGPPARRVRRAGAQALAAGPVRRPVGRCSHWRHRSSSGSFMSALAVGNGFKASRAKRLRAALSPGQGRAVRKDAVMACVTSVAAKRAC
jgi:hypothetical protein